MQPSAVLNDSVFSDPRALNAKGLGGQIDGRARDRELLHTVFHTKLAEIRSSCFDRHLIRSCSLKYLKHMIAQGGGVRQADDFLPPALAGYP